MFLKMCICPTLLTQPTFFQKVSPYVWILKTNIFALFSIQIFRHKRWRFLYFLLRHSLHLACYCVWDAVVVIEAWQQQMRSRLLEGRPKYFETLGCCSFLVAAAVFWCWPRSLLARLIDRTIRGFYRVFQNKWVVGGVSQVPKDRIPERLLVGSFSHTTCVFSTSELWHDFGLSFFLKMYPTTNTGFGLLNCI